MNEFQNVYLKTKVSINQRLFLIFLFCFVGISIHSQESEIPRLSVSDMNIYGRINFQKVSGWKISGYKPEIIKDTVNLLHGIPITSLSTIDIKKVTEWRHYAWFELVFNSDSSLAEADWMVLSRSVGAVNIWLNGKEILSDGTPSELPENEVLGRMTNPHRAIARIREGTNYLLVEFSNHTLPKELDIFSSNVRSNLNIYLRPYVEASVRRIRGFIYGGTLLLLTLLLITHLFLAFKTRAKFHVYVVLTTLFMLVHASATMSDTIINWSYSFYPVHEVSTAVAYTIAAFFFLLAIREFLNLKIPFLLFLSSLTILVSSGIYAIFYNRDLLNIIHPISAAAILIYGAYSIYEARNTSPKNEMRILAIGLAVAMIGALLYVGVYLIFEQQNLGLFYFAILCAYTGIPTSLTFTVAASYANLFKDLEKKVDERTSELAEANKFKTLFFTNIAHEFRTPLTISKGLIKQLSDPMGSDKCKDELEKISVVDRNITRLEGLINQIIDLTKADEHKLTTNPDWYNAEELVLHSVSSLKELAKSKYQKYQFNSLVHNLILFVDRLKIETIFNNLISNAIKYTPNGGEINIATYLSQESNIFSFKVEDTGNGIPNGEEDSIFTRFHRLHNGHDYEEGMGIGLEVSRTYARLLGGDVIVEKARKTGACFIFNLPLFPTNSRFEEVELTRAVVTNLSVNNKSIDEPIQTDSSGKSYSILLVEDNKDMARYISSILSSIGRIQHTFNGFEAIEKLKEFKPDIIITDLMMPQMDGAAFVKYLAENEEFLKLPVIVLTATALEDNKLHLLRIGVVDYITKPFNAESLLLKIRNLLYYYEKRKTMELVIKEDTSIIIENVADKAAQFVIKNLGNYNVSVESLADYFEISRRSFYRLLATETGMTPAEFIREIRLTKARDLITRNSKLKLNELANLVGYKSVANFTKLYEKRFGIHPGKEGVLN